MDEQQIKKIYAFLCSDDEGEEGIVARCMSTGWMPLICNNERTLTIMKKQAQIIARETNSKVTLAEFSCRKDLEHYGVH